MSYCDTQETWKQAVEHVLGLEVGVPMEARTAVTGEPYVTITSGGIKPEGMGIAAIALRPDKAWWMFVDQVVSYANAQIVSDRMPKLYWRETPTRVMQNWSHWEHDQMITVPVYWFRARLLVSAAPAKVAV